MSSQHFQPIFGMIPLGTMEQTDDQLVALAREGDGDAFAELALRHRPKMINVARRYVSDEDARDVASDAFMKAWKNFETFAGKASFSTWLFSITRNTAINWATRRTELPLPVGEEGELTLDPADTGQDGPEIAAIKKDVVAKLAVAMRKLSTKQREAVLLRKEGLTYQEIANRLSCNRETVKTRVRDGLEKLRRLLEQQGVERNTISRSLTGQ